jgi:F-type H+-transporting ATPase subunit delta
MAERDALVEAYAEALLLVAEAEGVLDEVEDELFRFGRTLEAASDLREALTDPALPVERKKAVLEDLLGGKAIPHTINMLGFVLEQGRGRQLAKIAEGVSRMAAERRSHEVAEVRTAIPLTEEQRAELARALGRATGKTVDLKVLVDPEVIGGAVARVGDQVFDGTVQSRLEQAKERMGSM